jgi:dihydroflavonol-4-reductase
MRALVLGATGHIGAHVVRALLGRGYAVRATYRDPRYTFLLDGLPVERMPLDLEDASRLRSAVEDCALVFVCAGYYPRWTQRRASAIQRGIAQIRGLFDVLRQAQPQRIIYTSSAATIAPVPGRAVYATVKIAMERAVWGYVEAGLPIVITNPSVCIGEYDAHTFSGRLVLLFAGKRWRLPVSLEHEFNVVYTGDVGLAHVLAAERGRIGEGYLLAGEQTTLVDFARQAARIAGVPPPRWRIPLTLGRPQQLDGSRARQAFDLQPTPMEEAIRRAVSWFRLHGYL